MPIVQRPVIYVVWVLICVYCEDSKSGTEYRVFILRTGLLKVKISCKWKEIANILMFKVFFLELCIYFNDEKANESCAEELHESLSQATYENTETQYCVNINNEDETGADVKQIEEFSEAHLQSEKQEDEEQEEEEEEEEKEVEGTSQKRLLEECKLKSYRGALNTSESCKNFR
jgi:hypothetical protein